MNLGLLEINATFGCGIQIIMPMKNHGQKIANFFKRILVTNMKSQEMASLLILAKSNLEIFLKENLKMVIILKLIRI